MPEPHSSTARLAYLGVDEISSQLATGDLTSVELVQGLLERMTAVDGPDTTVGLRSVAAMSASALDEAAALDAQRDRGESRGELHGVPVLIKDNIEVAGLPGAAGSTALRGRPASDAPLVSRLRAAGAIVIGSTNLSEWANIRSPRSTSGWSATGGLVANPWHLAHSAGGSSSGSGAAVAAGLAPLAVGTETDGSIVCPASLNGIVGLKPTVGTVSTVRVVPISASHDSPGPMGRRVSDVARMFGVLSGQSAPAAAPTEIRFAFATSWVTGEDGTDQLIRDVVGLLRASGSPVVDRVLPTPGEEQYGDELTVLLAELHDDLGSYLSQRPGEGVRSLADVVSFENEHADVEMPYFGHELFEHALDIGGRRGEKYGPARARNLEWAMNDCLAPGLEGVDVIVAPAYGPAWVSDLAGGDNTEHAASCVTMPAAIAGFPILSLPAGSVRGFPVGLALVSRPHEEWRLLAAARHVESVITPDTFDRPTWLPR